MSAERSHYELVPTSFSPRLCIGEALTHFGELSVPSCPPLGGKDGQFIVTASQLCTARPRAQVVAALL